jgi:hypothetical protein
MRVMAPFRVVQSKVRPLKWLVLALHVSPHGNRYDITQVVGSSKIHGK